MNIRYFITSQWISIILFYFTLNLNPGTILSNGMIFIGIKIFSKYIDLSCRANLCIKMSQNTLWSNYHIIICDSPFVHCVPFLYVTRTYVRTCIVKVPAVVKVEWRNRTYNRTWNIEHRLNLFLASDNCRYELRVPSRHVSISLYLNVSHSCHLLLLLFDPFFLPSSVKPQNPTELTESFYQ